MKTSLSWIITGVGILSNIAVFGQTRPQDVGVTNQAALASAEDTNETHSVSWQNRLSSNPYDLVAEWEKRTRGVIPSRQPVFTVEDGMYRLLPPQRNEETEPVKSALESAESRPKTRTENRISFSDASVPRAIRDAQTPVQRDRAVTLLEANPTVEAHRLLATSSGSREGSLDVLGSARAPFDDAQGGISGRVPPPTPHVITPEPDSLILCAIFAGVLRVYWSRRAR